MTVAEAITKSGITPSASYTGIETADDFVFAIQTESTGTVTSKTGTQRTFSISGNRCVGDDFQDFALSHKIKYGTGSDVIVPYIYFSIRTGKGESGSASLIVTSDAGGAAGSPATFACDVKSIGIPAEFNYITAAAG